MAWQVRRIVSTKDGSDYGIMSKVVYCETADEAKRLASVDLRVPVSQLVAERMDVGFRMGEDPDGNILQPPTKEEVGRLLGLGRPATDEEYAQAMQSPPSGTPIEQVEQRSGQWW